MGPGHQREPEVGSVVGLIARLSFPALDKNTQRYAVVSALETPRQGLTQTHRKLLFKHINQLLARIFSQLSFSSAQLLTYRCSVSLFLIEAPGRSPSAMCYSPRGGRAELHRAPSRSLGQARERKQEEKAKLRVPSMSF